MASLVFLAAEVVQQQESVEVPLRPLSGADARRASLLQRLPLPVTFDITLRLWDGERIHVLDFSAGASGSRLARWERTPPTADDLAYLRKLDVHDVRPVDVHGQAYHGA